MLQDLNENQREVRSHSETDKAAVVANILKGYEDFTLDASGRIISSNLEAVNVTGYEEWEVIGQDFSIFYSDQDKVTGQPQKDLEKARRDGKLTFSDWRIKKRNVAFWAQVTLSSVNDLGGFHKGYKMVLKDQTHRLISNSRVKRFRGEYLNLFNNPFIGIFKFRMTDHKLVLINDKAGKIFGMHKELTAFKEVFSSGDEFQSLMDKLYKEGKVSGFEFQLKSKTSLSWARIDCRVFSSDGFAEGIITDITESKEQLLKLKSVNEELDRFIYHASHDLRSPLTTLMGLINLTESDDQIELKEYCRMMRERVSYLDELLHDLASITYNTRWEINVQAIDFEEIIQQQIEEHRQGQKDLNVSFSLMGDGHLFSDRARIQVILRKLFANAIRHSNPRAHAPAIQIHVHMENGKAMLIFKDNGRGIKDDQLVQVFGMFYKSSNEVIETGLSLYIARLMVDKLKGKIRVKSKEGVGSEFEIELPDLRVEEPGQLYVGRNGNKRSRKSAPESQSLIERSAKINVI